MSHVNTRARLAGVVSILSLLTAAGTALAQGARVEGSVDQPMKSKASGGGSGSTSTMIKSIEGDDTYEISIVDGQTTAKINGKKVPEDRVRRSEGKIELLDREGNVAHTFHVGAHDGRVFSFGGGHGGGHAGDPSHPFSIQIAPEGQSGQWRVLAPGESAQGMRSFQPQVEPPPVMLGVTMSDPSDDEREEFDLAEGKGIRIDRVIEGLPADEAGVEAGDIVLSVNGKPASADDLRAVLKEKNAGDTITLRVVRGDEKKSLKVELAQYDPQKLGNSVAPMQAFPGGARGENPEQMQKLHEEMMKLFHEFDETFPGGPGGHGGQFRGRVLGVQPGQEMQWFTMPGDQGKRLEELSERLEKLDARLDDLNRKLEKLAAALDKR